MNQKSLSNWLKMMIIGVGICGLLICVLVLPMLTKELETLMNEKWVCWAWLILLWITSIPCFVALIFSWRIMSNIGNDKSFTKENAGLLKQISGLAIGDAVFLFIWKSSINVNCMLVYRFYRCCDCRNFCHVITFSAKGSRFTRTKRLYSLGESINGRRNYF